ncbi:hypothetical protein CROQUDRAFT_675013 [Cronartium quercuum f. sp. fusiforme G11]|uniref:eRF1/Pelota-like N-terminal domain-containing protein n=1 Tax=Cronartium quercuum f. sp. fusiforme G11 TaxID=708437 RepID=A0A9P6N5I2_9BASI|nr:hypothetical protein CROQUDRAFT_675013 [Cronartium quercuum f. sp. fusiforme G11]
MKQIKKIVDKTRAGRVTLQAENDEDMWHAYNLIHVGDEVKALTDRKIITETNSGTGNKESHRIKTKLTIEVKKMTYSGVELDGAEMAGDGPSTGARKTVTDTALLTVSGVVSEPNPHVKMGAFHKLDLEAGCQFTIIKGPGGWDSIHLERIKESADSARGADVGAILCDDSGRATICLIGSHTTVVKQRIEVNVAKKKKAGHAGGGPDKVMDKFYRQIYDAILKHFNLDDLKIVIFASPGTSKDSAYEWVIAEAVKTGNKGLLTSKPKIKRLPITSAHVRSLNEVLSSPQIANQLKDTKYSKEIQALEKFDKMLVSDELRAWYGESHIDKAAERGAIGTLLISDGLFRNSDPVRRKKFIDLTESVKQFGGTVLVFSTMHASGTRLSELTGVAAMLTYPLDMDVIEAEDREAVDSAANS